MDELLFMYEMEKEVRLVVWEELPPGWPNAAL